MSRLLFAALLVPALVAADAASLSVTVKNVDAKGGILRVSLYDEFSWSAATDAPLMSANVPAVAPETVATFADVKPGVYGIKLYQDVNENGKFDQNFLGLPLERYGFSRDARPFLSEPGFDHAKFIVHDDGNAITIHLQ